MSMQIKYVKDAGIIKDERLVLEVIRDCDIGSMLVFDTTFLSEGSISNKLRHCFWFPDKLVEAGDTVVLYSKTGADSEKQNKNGFRSHFFYWGLDKTIWNKGGDCALLMESKDWSYKKVK